MWSAFTYHDELPPASNPPIPHTPSPNSNASVTDTGFRSRVTFAASATWPSAVGSGSFTSAPLPPVPWPKQVAAGSVGTLPAAVY